MFNITEFNNRIDCLYSKFFKNIKIYNLSSSKEDWTLIEMIGHLIDSASNNHQRFIRLQQGHLFNFPGYDAEQWRGISKIKDLDYMFLLNLWKNYNQLIIHLIKNIKEVSLYNYWEVNNKKITLEYLVNDYFDHMKWHEDLLDKSVEYINLENKIINKI